MTNIKNFKQYVNENHNIDWHQKLLVECPEGHGMTAKIYFNPPIRIGQIDGKDAFATYCSKGYEGVGFGIRYGSEKTSLGYSELFQKSVELPEYVNGKMVYINTPLNIDQDCFEKLYKYLHTPAIQNLQKEVAEMGKVYKKLNPNMISNRDREYTREESIDWTEASNYFSALSDGEDPNQAKIEANKSRNMTADEIEKERQNAEEMKRISKEIADEMIRKNKF